MAFKKGKPKTGGRQKGIENKVTQDARARFMDIMEGEVDHVKDSLSEVRKEDKATYLKLLAQLFPYFLPKMTEVNVKGTITNDSKPFHEWANDNTE
jgi:hypothetical protein